MKEFIVFSDLHLNLWNYGAKLTATGKNSRLMQQIDFLNDIERFATQNNIEHVFFCGDLFHTHEIIKTEVLQEAMKVFSRWKAAGLKAFFVVGNHDFADRAGTVHALEFLKDLNFVVADTEIHTAAGDMPVSLMPYTEDEDALDEFLYRVKDGSLVFMHQGVAGVELNSKGFTLKGEILSADKVPDKILHAFVGHYHSHRRVSRNLTIPGSPMQLTWNDKGEHRGFLHVKLEPELKYNMIDSICSKFVELEHLPTLKSEGNFVRFTTSDSSKVADIREELSDAASVEVIVRKEIEEAKMEETFDSFEEIFNNFIKTKKLDNQTEEIGRALIGGAFD